MSFVEICMLCKPGAFSSFDYYVLYYSVQHFICFACCEDRLRQIHALIHALGRDQWQGPDCGEEQHFIFDFVCCTLESVYTGFFVLYILEVAAEYRTVAHLEPGAFRGWQAVRSD